jgi:hypothetical protein
MIRWQGRGARKPCQVANAREDFVDLAPASEIPAAQVHEAWSALLPGQEVPLIWEAGYGDREEDDCG